MTRQIIQVLMAICLAYPVADVQAGDPPLAGVNLAGAEFKSGSFWPSEACIDYWHQAGVRLIRLPFLWERLQPTLMQDFDPTYAGGLEHTVDLLEKRQMQVILDVHNYMHYRGKPIGSPDVPNEAFKDLWARLATIYKARSNIWGYGLMNEPGKGWRDVAQYGIDGVRSADPKTQILVANDYAGWSATRANLKGLDLAEWAAQGMAFPDPSLLKDPAQNLRWELHAYFDHDASGTYRKPYDEEIARRDGPEQRVRPEIGIHRIGPFVAWLKKHNARGFLGEYSAPDSDPRWMEILDRTLAYLKENDLPSTYWAGGQGWSHGGAWCIERNGWPKDLPPEERLKDRPQLLLLRKHFIGSNLK